MLVLIDTNVLIDYIQKRTPFYISAEKIFNACAENKMDGSIAAHSVSNLFYILRKRFTVEERKELLKMLCIIFAPLRDIEKFKNACTVMNGTLAWDISGKWDESDCIDIEPFTVYELDGINNMIA